MLRSMIVVVVLTLAITAVLSIDTTVVASAPEEVAYPKGTVCFLGYEERSGNVVTLSGVGIPNFTVRIHNGLWDQISFHNAMIPIRNLSVLPCPLSYLAPG